MTKTEQLLLDRVRFVNDRGDGALSPVSETKGRTGSWRRDFGRTVGQKPKKNEADALAALIERGEVEKRDYLYYVKDHLVLSSVAAGMNLMRRARDIEEARKQLMELEEKFEQEQAFVQRWWGAK